MYNYLVLQSPFLLIGGRDWGQINATTSVFTRQIDKSPDVIDFDYLCS